MNTSAKKHLIGLAFFFLTCLLLLIDHSQDAPSGVTPVPLNGSSGGRLSQEGSEVVHLAQGSVSVGNQLNPFLAIDCSGSNMAKTTVCSEAGNHQDFESLNVVPPAVQAAHAVNRLEGGELDATDEILAVIRFCSLQLSSQASDGQPRCDRDEIDLLEKRAAYVFDSKSRDFMSSGIDFKFRWMTGIWGKASVRASNTEGTLTHSEQLESLKEADALQSSIKTYLEGKQSKTSAEEELLASLRWLMRKTDEEE